MNQVRLIIVVAFAMWMLSAESCLQIDKCMLLNSPHYHQGAGYLLNLLWRVDLEGILHCFDVIWLPVRVQGCFSRNLIFGVPRQQHMDHLVTPG